MTRKHFEAVATGIKQQVEAANGNKEVLTTIAQTAAGLANTFAEANPCFDRVRFARACGLN